MRPDLGFGFTDLNWNQQLQPTKPCSPPTLAWYGEEEVGCRVEPV